MNNMEKNKFTHKLLKSSKYSYVVTVPKEVIERYGWREKQKLTVIDKGRGKIEISDWKRR